MFLNCSAVRESGLISKSGICADRGFGRPVQEGIEVCLQDFALLLQGDLHIEHLGALHLGLEDILLHPLADGILRFGKGDEIIENPDILVHDLQRLVDEVELVVGFLDHPSQFQLALLHLHLYDSASFAATSPLRVPFSPERQLLGDADHLLGHGVLAEIERARTMPFCIFSISIGSSRDPAWAMRF